MDGDSIARANAIESPHGFPGSVAIAAFLIVMLDRKQRSLRRVGTSNAMRAAP